jgi:hypothetical protein
MAIRSNSDPRYYRRFLIMGIAALGFAVYCLYDGTIGYPRKRVSGFADFKSEFTHYFSAEQQGDLTLDEFEAVGDEDARQAWEKYSHDRGIKSRADVIMQFVMAAGSGAIGLWLLWGVFRARGRWIEASDTELTSSWGQSLNYDQIVSIDKRKWRKKGIAKIRYQDGGRTRRFTIDDFKFERDATDHILYEIEKKIGYDKITGGPPESASAQLADGPSEELVEDTEPRT